MTVRDRGEKRFDVKMSEGLTRYSYPLDLARLARAPNQAANALSRSAQVAQRPGIFWCCYDVSSVARNHK